MSSAFFVCAFAVVALPPLFHRLLGLGGWPVVFVQLLLGMLVTACGLTDGLRGVGVDLRTGRLADALQGVGLLGVCLLIALGGRHDAEAADDAAAGKSRDWRFVPISIVGFAVTAAIGASVGWMLAPIDPSLLGPHVGRAGFAAATGLLLSVTALPVLMAILAQTGLAGTRLGTLATRCASLDDLWLWLAMAAVLAFGGATAVGTASPLRTVAAFVVHLVVLFGVLRPLLARWMAGRRDRDEERIVGSLAVILLSAAATDAIGLHPILGAFLGGAVLPASALRGWREPLLAFSARLLLPFFFVTSGLAVRFDAADAGFWGLVLLLTAVATSAKFGSVSIVARLCGLPWHEAFTLGSLMQCKGLMELAAVAVLQQAGVIDGRMGSALAVMAVVSTLITAPAVRACRSGGVGRPRLA